ncbi:MAG TPA: hypothetical protein VD788_00375 [Candidatus Polarisedimenticolaceae bacterium]|nr:hypothetical protein [Candidatus Polarisedimenticolaceae bacterium]
MLYGGRVVVGSASAPTVVVDGDGRGPYLARLSVADGHGGEDLSYVVVPAERRARGTGGGS